MCPPRWIGIRNKMARYADEWWWTLAQQSDVSVVKVNG
jgi:hypothetical protein